jgi:preprotein translocase subunit SecD
VKRQFSIFLIVSVLIAVLGLTYGARTITDLTLLYPTTVDIPGTRIILSLDESADAPEILPKEYTLQVQGAHQVLSKRLEEMYPHQNYQITIHNNRLEVVLPTNENTPYTIHVITQVGEIEFVDGGNKLPRAGQLVEKEDGIPENTYQTLFTGREITTIVPPNSDTGEIFYQFQLQPTAAQRVADFIRSSNKAYACLVIDKQIVNCSTMYHLSGNTLDILPNLGGETGMNLADLAIFLKSGPLPASLEVITN